MSMSAGRKVKRGDGLTALLVSSFNGHMSSASLLARGGADVHYRSASGWNAVHYACFNGHTDIAAMLIQQHNVGE